MPAGIRIQPVLLPQAPLLRHGLYAPLARGMRPRRPLALSRYAFKRARRSLCAEKQSFCAVIVPEHQKKASAPALSKSPAGAQGYGFYVHLGFGGWVSMACPHWGIALRKEKASTAKAQGLRPEGRFVTHTGLCCRYKSSLHSPGAILFLRAHTSIRAERRSAPSRRSRGSTTSERYSSTCSGLRPI